MSHAQQIPARLTKHAQKPRAYTAKSPAVLGVRRHFHISRKLSPEHLKYVQARRQRCGRVNKTRSKASRLTAGSQRVLGTRRHSHVTSNHLPIETTSSKTDGYIHA